MRKKSKLLGILALVVVFGFLLVGCDFPTEGDDSGGNGNNGNNNGGGNNSNNPIQLAFNTWADGVILTSSGGGQQWFKFTATANAQHIHVSIGTLTDMYVQVYDSSGNTVGNESNMWSLSTNFSLTLATGQEYKIRVRPYSTSSSGTYRIGFTGNSTAPRLPFPEATQMNVATWTNGNFTTSGYHWYKFTSTASTQYLHIQFGTLSSCNILVYNSNGIAVGSEGSMSNLVISRTLTVGQEYHVRVYTSGSGSYNITFNSTSMPPIGSTTQLNLNTWTDGVFLTSGIKEEWFSFSATAINQYIHLSFGTLSDTYVQVFDSNGSTVGSEANMWSLSRNISRTLVVDQVYYIRVRPYSNSSHGTYKITFNNSTIPPSGS